MGANGSSGNGDESSGNGAAPESELLAGAKDGERPFDDRTASSLMVLGEAIAGLNERVNALNAFTGSNAVNAVEAFRDLAEQVAAQERRTSAIEAALIALGKAAGLSPVWSDERGNRPATH